MDKARDFVKLYRGDLKNEKFSGLKNSNFSPDSFISEVNGVRPFIADMEEDDLLYVLPFIMENPAKKWWENQKKKKADGGIAVLDLSDESSGDEEESEGEEDAKTEHAGGLILPFDSYEEFCDALRIRFGSGKSLPEMAQQMRQIKQGSGGVREYWDELYAAYVAIQDRDSSYFLHFSELKVLFKSGLSKPLREWLGNRNDSELPEKVEEWVELCAERESSTAGRTNISLIDEGDEVKEENLHVDAVDLSDIDWNGKCLLCASSKHRFSSCPELGVAQQFIHSRKKKVGVVFGGRDRPFQHFDVAGFDLIFLLDTGSDLNVLSKSAWRKLGSPSLTPSSISASGVGGASLDIVGSVNLSILENTIPFVVAEIEGDGIVGFASMKHLKLDPFRSNDSIFTANVIQLGANETQHELESKEEVREEAENKQKGPMNKRKRRRKRKRRKHKPKNLNTSLEYWLELYPEVFNFSPGSVSIMEAAISLDSEKMKRGRKKVRARRWEGNRGAILKEIVQREIENGVLSLASEHTPFCSNFVLVPKDEGKWRITSAFEQLNEVIEHDNFPSPSIPTIMESLRGAKIFSVIDFKSFFHQIRLRERDRHMTGVHSPLGVVIYNVLPQGMVTSSSVAQRLASNVLTPLGLFSYQDDIIIGAKDEEEMEEKLHQLFQRLEECGLSVSANKIQLFKEKIEALGRSISSEGATSDSNSLQAIEELKAPNNRKELSSLLGVMGVVRPYLPNYSSIIAPLQQMMKNPRWVEWQEEDVNLLEDIKKKVKEVAIVEPVDYSKKIIMKVDASKSGYGAVLFNEDEEGERGLVGVMSLKWPGNEGDHSNPIRELYGIHHALKYYSDLLYKSKVYVETDCKALINMNFSNPILQRIRAEIYSLDIEISFAHCMGSTNEADPLSRVATITQDSWKEEQLEDPLCIQLRKLLSGEIEFDEIPDGFRRVVSNIAPRMVEHDGVLFKEDKAKLKVLVPESLREEVMSEVHIHLAHPAISGTRRGLREFCFWPGMSDDAARFVMNCGDCIRGKPPTQSENHGVGIFTVPLEVNGRGHVDHAGRFPAVRGFKYLLIMVDFFSKFVIAIPSKTTSSKENLRLLIDHWISIFGPPQILVSDNGTCFSSNIWKKAMEDFQIDHRFSAVYFPQTNGAAERAVKTIKERLRVALLEEGSNWVDAIPKVVNGINKTPNEVTGISPWEVIFKEVPSPQFAPHRNESSVTNEEVKNSLEEASKRYQKEGRSRKSFSKGDRVVVRDMRPTRKPLEPYFTGEGTVDVVLPDNQVIVNMDNGRICRRNWSHLRAIPP